MGDIRVKVADFAVEMFPHIPNTVEALRCLVSVANEIIQDIEDLERMMSIPVGTVEDPCMHYEKYEDPW